MEPIKLTLGNVIKALEAQRKSFAGAAPEEVLKNIFPKKDLKHIRFHYFKKGVLSIKVDSAVWLYHLSLQKEDLIAKLGKRYTAVKGLRFSIGEMK